MGVYNFHAPYILGNEWVPIREEVTQLTPAANVVEYGHRFSAGTALAISDGRFYVKPPLPKLADRGQTFMMAAYSIDGEDQFGAVQRVVIPVNAVVSLGATVSGAPDAVTALLTGSSSSGISLDVATTADVGLAMSFAVGAYPQLNGKRILGVNLLSAVAASSDITGPTRNTSTSRIMMATNTTINSVADPQALFGRLRLESELDRTPFGEINQFWTANSPHLTSDRVPWTYTQLKRLDTTATQLYVKIESGTNRGTTVGSSLFVYYAALEVLFCEEKRVIYGATQFGSANSHSFGIDTVIGANKILMHDLAGNVNPTLPVGRYLLVISSADVGGLSDNLVQNTSSYPDLNALRQLYVTPPHPGIKINIPFPMDDTAVGKEFTAELTDILPQMSLHIASSVAMVEPHVYGQQAAAQVYGTITATQEIGDNLAGGATTWPQVRYYARRFGQTTVPLLLDSPVVTGTGRSVLLTPAEWDALPELIDGWKEVTKRFATPPTMGAGTTPQWRFSATAEQPGNRWEVLGAIAPAISGIGGNLQNKVPTADRLDAGTYGATSGAGGTINLGWIPGYAPPVTATTDDSSADAVLIFSQDPATISGLTVTTNTQALTGFTECTHGPCCLPTALQYNRVTWNLPTNTADGWDNFDRVVVTGLGSSDLGGAYALTESGASYAVDGAEARITPAVGAAYAYATLAMGSNFDATVVAGTEFNLVAGSTGRVGLTGRYTDANNNYIGFVQTVQSTGVSVIVISKVVAGIETVLLAVPSPVVIDGMSRVNIRFMGDGVVLKLKAWPLNESEPVDWNVEFNDASLATGSRVGIVAQSRSVVGSTYAFDNLRITPPRWNFGHYELQRFDPIGLVWETIMLTTSPAVTGFNDYEARVGVASQYQIRQTNALDFAGGWSITGTGTITEPGVTMPSCGTNRRGVLIFTSNEVQDGSSNLAYAMTWDNDVVESFSFPEVNQFEVQSYLDRDYQVAFHGTERGGEQFTRRILLANATVSVPRLNKGPVKSIGDLAWRDLAYVCVRDDIGDRWYATIVIPSSEVRRNRRLHNAELSVIEVTDTPSEVDVTWP